MFEAGFASTLAGFELAGSDVLELWERWFSSGSGVVLDAPALQGLLSFNSQISQTILGGVSSVVMNRE